MTGETEAPRCPACGYPVPGAVCARCEGTVRRSSDGKVVVPGPKNPITDLVHGFVSLPAGAIALFTRKEYFGKLALAVTANIVATVVLIGGMFWGLWALSDWALGTDWAGWDWARQGAEWLAAVLSFVTALLLVWLLSPVLVETVMSPFLDPIAEATERAWVGGESKAVDPGVWSGMLYSTRIAAQILLIQLALLLPLFALSLTGIGTLIAMAVTAWLNALVWVDLPCSRRGYDLRTRVALIRRNWARAVGFGFAFQLSLLVLPFSLLILTPAAAVGMSTLYFHFDKSNVPGADRTGTILAPPRPPSGSA